MVVLLVCGDDAAGKDSLQLLLSMTEVLHRDKFRGVEAANENRPDPEVAYLVRKVFDRDLVVACQGDCSFHDVS